MKERAIGELEFLRKLQRLLAEGDFVATYKLALLNALADLSVEGELERDGSLRVGIEALATKFIEYYWPQARPYGAGDGSGFVLLQNAGKQAAVINALKAIQGEHATLAAARGTRRWRSLVRDVGRTYRVCRALFARSMGSCSTRCAARGYARSRASARTERSLPTRTSPHSSSAASAATFKASRECCETTSAGSACTAVSL
jgi:hypothetical protein